MGEGSESFTDRVTQGEDGVYRWYYDMDMYENKSILCTLEKVNLYTFLGVSFGGALLVGIVARDFGAPIVRGIFLIGLAMMVLMAALYAVGFYIAAWIKGGRYRIRFAMREDGIELVWSDAVNEGFETGRSILSLVGAATGSRRVRGRWRPSLSEVSNAAFSSVSRIRRYPEWNMIDLSMPGGKFQVYADSRDIDGGEAFIRARVSERAQRD